MRGRLGTWASGVAGLAAGLAWASSAGAQEVAPKLGGPGVQLILSADRLFGVNYYKHTSTSELESPSGTTKVEATESTTAYAFLWSYAASSRSVPRLSFDASVAHGFTVGGSFGLFGYSSKPTSKVSGPGTQPQPDDNDKFSGNVFVFAPRVGYVVMFTDVIGLWPRLALTYATSSSKHEYDTTNPSDNTKTKRTSTRTEWNLGASVEVPLLIAPVQHVAFTVGPVFDWFPVGKYDYKVEPEQPSSGPEPKNTVTLLNVGVNCGLLGWF